MSTAVKLNVPYRSQWDADADDHSADCGPTSLAMILNAMGDPVTPDELYQYIGERGYSQYTSFSDLKRAASGRKQLEMTRKNFLPGNALGDLAATIDAGKPFIALVNYAFWDPFLNNGFRGSHFVLVTGYDAEHVYVHDPLFKGDRREQGRFYPFTNKQFTDAWGGFAPNVNPNYAVLIAEAAIPHLEGGAGKSVVAQATGAPEIDDMLRRRILAKAAYDGQPTPDLTNAAVVNQLTAELGDWGESWDMYTIRRGDNLANVARVFYYDGDKYPVIVYFNDILNPDLIEVGQVVLVPRTELNQVNDATVALPGYGGPTG